MEVSVIIRFGKKKIDLTAAERKLIEDPGNPDRDPRAMADLRERLLVESGVTQTDLARRPEFDCSQGFVSDLVRGKGRSRPKEEAFARLFGMSWEALFNPPSRAPIEMT